MTVTQASLESEFAGLERQLLGQPELAREFVESQVHYFAVAGDAKVARDPLSLRRHLEWFLLERVSQSQGGVPVELLVHAGEDTGSDEHGEREEVLAALLGSLASIFEVTSVVAGEGLWVRDLAGGGEYVLEEPQLAQRLQVEDLVVGRLYPVGESLHRVSKAAGFFRDERLVQAVRGDLERARAGRHGSLRLSQLELEKMFLGTTTEEQETNAWERASGWLAQSGLDAERIGAIGAALRAEPYDPERPLAGGDDALGRVLTALAFDTDIDLEAARVALLAAWIELSQPASGTAVRTRPKPERAQDGKVDVRAAMEAFDRGRAEGRDLEQLFDELEQDLEIDEDESEEEAIAPDFPGVVGAMVEEYLWECEQEHGAERARAQAGLRRFADYASGIGLFESVGLRELLVFGAVWLPEAGELADADDARATMTALKGFCSWCEQAQSVPLASAFAQGPEGMLSSLPRVTKANALRVRGVEPTEGALHEVREVEGARVHLADAAGEVSTLQLAPELASNLAPGDRVRGALQGDGQLAVYCVYPPECALIGPA